VKGDRDVLEKTALMDEDGRGPRPLGGGERAAAGPDGIALP